MKWLTDIVTGGIGDLVKTGADIIDEYIESPDEKRAAIDKLSRRANDLKVKAMDAAVEYDKQVTERLKTDMASDSWLSKNIRPLTLAVTGVSIYVLAFTSVFVELTPLQIGLVETWVTALVSLFGVMVTFYFGSRGIEKIKKTPTVKSGP